MEKSSAVERVVGMSEVEGWKRSGYLASKSYLSVEAARERERD